LRAREIGFFCPGCSRYNVYELPEDSPGTLALTCDECGRVETSRPSAVLQSGGPIDRCPHCGNTELYIRKDFPQQLGCAAVSATIILSTVAFALWGFLPSLAVLVVASLVDFALYHRLGELTVCYRCHCELRGFAPNPGHHPFDISRAEEYEHGR
jgi:hypothetical protein